jgi:hypothetical protein
MIDAEASLEIYNICMNSKQNLGSNSAVIKTRGAMRGYYNLQEVVLKHYLYHLGHLCDTAPL